MTLLSLVVPSWVASGTMSVVQDIGSFFQHYWVASSRSQRSLRSPDACSHVGIVSNANPKYVHWSSRKQGHNKIAVARMSRNVVERLLYIRMCHAWLGPYLCLGHVVRCGASSLSCSWARFVYPMLICGFRSPSSERFNPPPRRS